MSSFSPPAPGSNCPVFIEKTVSFLDVALAFRAQKSSKFSLMINGRTNGLGYKFGNLQYGSLSVYPQNVNVQLDF